MTKRLTTEEFIERAKKVHGNDKYDYSQVSYSGQKEKIEIICNKCYNTFQQIPSNHLAGKGCYQCSIERGSQKRSLSQKKFISEAQKIHGEKYDYSKTKYGKNYNEKVIVICPQHGEFSITPGSHIYQKGGCYKCGKIKMANKIRHTISDFIAKSKERYKDIYDYSLVEYQNCKTKIKILCKKHNMVFEQTPSGHYTKTGCIKCISSNGEKLISNWLEYNNVYFQTQKTFNTCKNRRKLKFDFYVPCINLIIEFDGLQHFYPVNRFGGKQALKKTIKRDKIKTQWAKDNNIPLLRIPYTHIEYINKILEVYMQDGINICDYPVFKEIAECK